MALRPALPAAAFSRIPRSIRRLLSSSSEKLCHDGRVLRRRRGDRVRRTQRSYGDFTDVTNHRSEVVFITYVEVGADDADHCVRRPDFVFAIRLRNLDHLAAQLAIAQRHRSLLRYGIVLNYFECAVGAETENRAVGEPGPQTSSVASLQQIIPFETVFDLYRLRISPSGRNKRLHFSGRLTIGWRRKRGRCSQQKRKQHRQQ